MASPLSDQIKRFLRGEHQIRDEATACNAVMQSIPQDVPMKDHFFGSAMSLTRSPVPGKKGLKRGDVIWVVGIANAAVSEIDPTPEGIYWVKAADGAVFATVPQS
jgi:hypothetical protein